MANQLPKHLLDKPLLIPAKPGRRPSSHVFEEDSILAVDTALACGRPLLLRGEPGVGKSQLARAVAEALGRVFVSVFVHARTDVHDLLWSYDAVTRLAEAQAHGAGQEAAAERLAQRRFVKPGPLWWALNWERALRQATGDHVATKAPVPSYSGECHPRNGVVLLIDEIDKADTSVPNGLLECLGQRTFTVPGIDEPIDAVDPTPLVMLTTNEDRVLPDAFVRRCVVLHMRMPDPEQWELPNASPTSFEEWLVVRGRAHFEKKLPDEVLLAAAKQVIKDRRTVREAGHCPPGLAEYIDLLAALAEGGSGGAVERINKIAKFVLHKHADPTPRRDDYRPGRGG